MSTFTITIPWPGKYNCPNSRTRSHRARARHIKEARTRSLAECLQHLDRPKGWERARVDVTAYHKTLSFKDPQNIIAQLKASIDGVEDAGVIVNDAGLEWGIVDRQKDAANPRVVLTFTEVKP